MLAGLCPVCKTLRTVVSAKKVDQMRIRTHTLISSDDTERTVCAGSTRLVMRDSCTTT